MEKSHWSWLNLKQAAKYILRVLLSFIIVSLLMISAVGCKKTEQTEIDDRVDFITKHDTVIYSYQTSNASLKDYGFVDVFNDLSHINYESYTVLLFDASKYRDLDIDFLNQVYDMLSLNSKIIIIFANSFDLSFLQNSKFSFSQDNYMLQTELNGFYNFSPGGIVGFSSQTTVDDPDDLFSVSVISAIYRRIYEDVKVQ